MLQLQSIIYLTQIIFSLFFFKTNLKGRIRRLDVGGAALFMARAGRLRWPHKAHLQYNEQLSATSEHLEQSDGYDWDFLALQAFIILIVHICDKVVIK